MSTKKRVLVAEDDLHLSKATVRLLTMAGYEVVPALDGQKAVSMLHESFDVIVSDIAMPNLGGLELLQAVREKDPDVPVILVTGAPSVDTAVKAIQYGALRYLLKPVDPQTMAETVAYAAHVHELAKIKREALATLGRQGEASDLADLSARFTRASNSSYLAFQPIVSCTQRTVYAYEALTRLDDAYLSNPQTFFDAAERLDRVVEIGRLVRERAAAAMPDLPDGVVMFLNLHPEELNDDALYSPVAPLTQHASRVVLEITERATLNSVSDLPKRLAALRGLGFKFALDDLGAGYAGLTSFVQLSPEVVKIDMELVRDVHTTEKKKKVIRSIGKLCRDMNIRVVAEGVETREEHRALEELGIELLQGYVFARPQRGFANLPHDIFG